MKKFYQRKWQNIAFNEFITTSPHKLANAEFYQKFYNTLFKRYHRWEQLPENWRSEKERCADFISTYAVGKRVLAVGCGLGYMEAYLQKKGQIKNFYIHEIAPAAWKMIEHEFSQDRKIIGFLPDCLDKDLEFDLIYIAAVDYALSDNELIDLLSSIRMKLSGSGHGRFLLISASFQKTPVTYKEKIKGLLRKGSDGILDILTYFKCIDRGQFWGWMRKREDYWLVMQRAGYHHIQDGFVDEKNQNHFWISGCSES